MIQVQIKVKNDHRSMTQTFSFIKLTLDAGGEHDPELLKCIQECVEKFSPQGNETIEEVIVKTKMGV